MNPALRYFTLGPALLFIIAFFVVGCEREHFDPQAANKLTKPADVKVVKVTKLTAPNQIEVVGTVQSVHKAEISTKITGNIQKLPVEVGTRVEPGDLLVEIKADEIDARLQQAKAQLEQAKRNLIREEKLLKKNAATPESVKELRDIVIIAEAGYSEARTMVGYTRITSPFSGIVTRKYSYEGDLATPGKSILQLEKEKELQILTDIPEAMVHSLKKGDQLTVSIPAVDLQTPGIITELSPTADPSSRTSPVKLKIAPHPHIRSGQFARVTLASEDSKTLAVPAEAVTKYGQIERVFVAQNETAQLRLIRTGGIINQGNAKYYEILSGLTESDFVVVPGSNILESGQPISRQ